MKKDVFKDGQCLLLSRVLAYMLPLIAIGMHGSDWVLYISLAIGVAAMLWLMLRGSLILTGKRQPVGVAPVYDEDVNDVFSFPYAFLLSSLIFELNGIDAHMGVWFALILAVLMLLSNHLPNKK